MKTNKYLIVQGELWSSHPFFKIFEGLDSSFVSFYKPITGLSPIKKNKIICFNEKYKNLLLWPLKIILRSFKLYTVIKNKNINCVVTHHDDANISVLLLILFFKFSKKNIKFFAYIHNGNFENKDLFNSFIRFNIKYLYKYFYKIITVSYANKNYLERKFKSLKNIEVIYNAIDIKKYISLSKEPLQKKYEILFKNNSFKFVTIGRFTLQKNLFNLLEIFSRLKNIDVKLFIIGDGELKKDLLKKIHEYNLEDKVFVIGFQNNVFNFIKKADCFILNSYWESFGQVLVEALIMNKVVISTDCESGPREILAPELKLSEKIKYPYFGKFGILTKPFNLNAENKISSNKLEELLRNIIINKKKYSKKYLNTIIRAKDFDQKNLLKEIRSKLK